MDSEKKKTEDLSFREAMADVTPLRSNDRIDPVPARTPAIARQRRRDEKNVIRELLSYPSDPAVLETGEELLFLRTGQQPRLLRRLRRGLFSVADTLEFIDQAINRGMGCVRIVHGKGLRSRDLPKLKIMTNQVLRKHPGVVAFASCRPVDGGTGATDVLLSGRNGARR